jgi:hypothetical protein
MENRMKNCIISSGRITRRFPTGASTTALAMAFAVSLAQPAYAGEVTPPSVPFNITVPEGNRAFLVGHAVGTQNYVCLPSATSATGVAYALFTPEATLFDDDGKQITTHFFSPNPFERNTSPALLAIGVIRATWQAKDSSSIWGKVRPADPNIPDDLGDSSTDPAFVAKGAIPWVKVTATGTADGPNGGDKLTKTTFVQRLNTSGGVAPSTGCASPSNVGNQAFVPYTADYFFYTDK